jgi:hypothetical protein
MYAIGGRLYAAVNAKAIDAGAKFGAELSASPKKLAVNEKVERWQAIWFADVNVIYDDAS